MDNESTFITDYIEYNSGNECPPNFHVWTALVVLSAAISRRCFIKQGYFTYYPGMYVALIGEQGDGKSSAKDIGKSLLISALPDVPVSPAVTTREAICKYLASDEAMRAFTNHEDTLIEYRPYTLFVNELKNFLSVNPAGMLNFLTDIYDSEHFINETKGKGTDIITRPFITMLACETPEWMIKNFRMETITGGFSRRLIIVYEIDAGTIKPFPIPPSNSEALHLKMKAHLQSLATLKGPFTWTQDARDFWEMWYRKNKMESNACTDPIMRGYKKTKHVQLLKVVMNLAAASYKPKLEITQNLLMAGLAILTGIEPNMPKLSIASGRNELALPQQKILELLERSKGELSEIEVRKFANKDLSPGETFSVLNEMKATKLIYYVKKLDPLGKIERTYILTEKQYALEVQAGRIKPTT